MRPLKKAVSDLHWKSTSKYNLESKAVQNPERTNYGQNNLWDRTQELGTYGLTIPTCLYTATLRGTFLILYVTSKELATDFQQTWWWFVTFFGEVITRTGWNRTSKSRAVKKRAKRKQESTKIYNNCWWRNEYRPNICKNMPKTWESIRMKSIHVERRSRDMNPFSSILVQSMELCKEKGIKEESAVWWSRGIVNSSMNQRSTLWLSLLNFVSSIEGRKSPVISRE